MGDFGQEDEDDLFGDFDDDGNGGENSVEESRRAKKGLIFVVDCGKSMLEKDEKQKREDDEEDDDDDEDEKEKEGKESEFDSCALQRAMEVAFLALRKRVITDSGSTNLVGMILYGTKEFKNDNGFENVVEYHSFVGIDVERIYDVKSMAKDAQVVVNKFGGSADPNDTDSALDRALWLCNFCFSGAKLKPYDEQKIWLFTNNDTPHAENESLKNKLLKRMEDLFQANQTLNVWPMVKRNKFDPSKFYQEVIDMGNEKFGKKSAATTDEEEQDLEDLEAPRHDIYWSDGLEKEDLVDFVRQKDFPKRKLAPVTLDIGNGVRLGLDLFPLLMRATLPLPQKLDGQTQSVIRGTTQYICQDTLMVLTPDQIENYFLYGVDSRVFVRAEEVRMLKRFGSPASITTLGFKPKDSIKPWYNLRSPYFVVPSEKKLEGSTKLFNALLKAMVEKDWVLYAVGTLRTSEACKFMCLIPREERLREDGVVMDYQGFDVIILPWANDIRRIQLNSGELGEEDDFGQRVLKASPELVKKAEAILGVMTLGAKDTTGRFFPLQNPNLQKHYAALESVALRGAGHEDSAMEWDPEMDDETLPQELGSAQRKALDSFKGIWGGLEDADTVKEVEKQLKKRKAAPTAGKSTAVKRPRTTTSRAKKSDASDWRSLAKDGKLNKLVVADLKSICVENGLSTSGRKADLVDRILEFFEQES